MRFNFIYPGMIMGVVVSLIILAVGVFAFFITIESINGEFDEESQNQIDETLGNITDGQTQIFNIIGIVLIIGAIMTVVGLVYSYVAPTSYSGSSSSSSSSSLTYSNTSPVIKPSFEKTVKKQADKTGQPPRIVGDYQLSEVCAVDSALNRAKEYRDNGYWVKIYNFSKNKKIKTTGDRVCGVYISKWSKDEVDTFGKPKFK